jgi:CrcB protein
MNISFLSILAVGSGGFLGAIARLLVNVHISKNFPSQIPLATLSVNIVGSFLIGVLLAIFITYTPSNELKAFLVTGFLGALTTFSTFAFESFELFSTSFTLAIINILLNILGTIIGVAIGYKLVLYFLR